MIQQTARITTNIDSQLLKFVDHMAREKDVTRRKVLEELIKRSELEKKGKEITEAYNRMAEDKEEMDIWLSIANAPQF